MTFFLYQGLNYCVGISMFNIFKQIKDFFYFIYFFFTCSSCSWNINALKENFTRCCQFQCDARMIKVEIKQCNHITGSIRADVTEECNQLSSLFSHFCIWWCLSLSLSLTYVLAFNTASTNIHSQLFYTKAPDVCNFTLISGLSLKSRNSV